jgi:uncharacterized protein YdiU (UPF0061 family)
MSILGLTIDYGPFGFLEYFDKKNICNHSDKEGRYTYENQPAMCKWNLMRLCEALEPIIPIEISRDIVNLEYDRQLQAWYYHTMLRKLGLSFFDQL